MEFKDKVKYVREKLHLSQVDLAKSCGVAFNTLNRWEKGVRKPTYVAIRKFYTFCESKGIIFED